MVPEVLWDQILGNYLPTAEGQQVRRIDPPAGLPKTTNYSGYCRKYVNLYKSYLDVLRQTIRFMKNPPDIPANQEAYPAYHKEEVRVEFFLARFDTPEKLEAYEKKCADMLRNIFSLATAEALLTFSGDTCFNMSVEQVREIQRREQTDAEPLAQLRALIDAWSEAEYKYDEQFY